MNRATLLQALLSILAGLAVMGSMRGIAAQQSKPAEGWAEFNRIFDQAVDKDRIAGAGVVFVADGRTVAHHEHGFADTASRRAVDANTIFHYGSITKTLTAMAIMQLRDRGRLTLEDAVTGYIPELRRVHDAYGSPDAITIRMLMSHSAGFQGPTWPYKQGKPWEPFEPTTWEQLVAMMPYQELEFAPGSRFGYSNPGFIYLAQIIEKLTGDPWETYIQKNIFAPLGLTRSYFGTTPYYLAADRSHNYSWVRDAGEAEALRDNGADFDPGITIPNGGWNAPLGDLATYLGFLTHATHGDAALQQRYDTVLKHSSLEEMWRPLHPVGAQTADKQESMGMSFFVLVRGGKTFIGHTGHQASFSAFFYLNPRNGQAVAAAFNTANEIAEGSEPAFDAIREAALKRIE